MKKMPIYDSYNNQSLLKILNQNSIDPFSNTKYKQLIYSHVYESNNKDKYNDDDDEMPKILAYDQMIKSSDFKFQFDLKDNLIILFENFSEMLFLINPEYYDQVNEKNFVELINSKRNTQTFVLRCKFYPYDLGLYSSLIDRNLKFYDTKNQEMIQKFSVKKGQKFNHMDWNSLNFKNIAIACNKNETLIYDHRTNYTTLILNTKEPYNYSLENKCQIVYWSPLDENGLFIGTSHGSINFFDIRQSRKPLAMHYCGYKTDILHISMTPDHRNIITMHSLSPSNHIKRWKIKQNNCYIDFLEEMPIYSNDNERNDDQFITFQAYENNQHRQPFITNKSITFFDTSKMNNKIKLLNYKFNNNNNNNNNEFEQKNNYHHKISSLCKNEFYSLLYLPFIEFSGQFNPFKNSLAFGYGSTNTNDECIPTIFYKCDNGFYSRRLCTVYDNPDIHRKFLKISNFGESDSFINDYWSSSSGDDTD